MVVMGIDPGSAVTGYGILKSEPPDPLRCLTCGCIRTRSGLSFEKRLKVIYDQIYALIEGFQPQQVAFEDIFLSQNVRAVFQLGQARGSAILAAVNAEIPVHFYSAREVKQALTGYGAATKEQVQAMVSALLDLDLSAWPLDTSDALAIAICHSHRCGLAATLQERSP